MENWLVKEVSASSSSLTCAVILGDFLGEGKGKGIFACFPGGREEGWLLGMIF